MIGALWLAWRYIRFHWGRTLLLLCALSMAVALPLAVRWSIARFERDATLRADVTPIVIGAKGSRFGLTIHALYFQGETAEMRMSDLQRVQSMELAECIPLLVKFKCNEYPVVGTRMRYFEHRKLRVMKGDSLRRLGDCLIGEDVAVQMQLKPGDQLLTESQSAFDLSSTGPMKLRVVGVLGRSDSADDRAIFCDIATAWIIQGIGHSHDLTPPAANSQSGQENSNSVSKPAEHLHSADSSLLNVATEVTDNNVSTFHFHGDEKTFPITAILAIPKDEKSGTILSGKFLSPTEHLQVLRPVDVVHELMSMIGQVRQVIDVAAILLSLTAGLLILLICMLSLRLRQHEMQTFAWLGASSAIILRTVMLELVLIVILSCGIGVALAWATSLNTEWFIQLFLSRAGA